MIDIIIPVYNSLKTLPYTLTSINLQTIKDKIEVHIIDDASTDNYEEILNDFQEKLNINYIKLPKNMGSGYARQYGLENSKNEYILFMDSDDLFYDCDSLKTLYNTIKTQKLDTVFSFSYDEYIKQNKHNNGDLHGKIYKREFVEKNNIKFNNTRFHEDNVFNNLILLHEPKCVTIPNTTYIYCNNESSITKSSKEQEFVRLEIYISNIKYVLDIAKQKNLNILLIKHFILTKTLYLQKVFNQVTKEKQETLILWLSKYNLNIEKYLKQNDIKDIESDIYLNYEI